MADYRLFVLENNGHITHPPMVFTCDTDSGSA
jgi:hypothetical protein